MYKNSNYLHCYCFFIWYNSHSAKALSVHRNAVVEACSLQAALKTAAMEEVPYKKGDEI